MLKKLTPFFTMLVVLTIVQMCSAQSTAELLGFDSEAKVLIINADDFGMCHAENVATMELLLNGDITSATVMVPCPWFSEAAEFCRNNPQLDVGIHLTLTSEWKRYKWGSVASSNLVPSLLTIDGYFPEDTPFVELWAKPEEVEIELRAQLEKALQAGMVPTHIDNHMATVYGLFSGRDFLDIVFDLSAEYGLPFRLPRNISAPLDEMLSAERIEKLLTLADSMVARGFALPDHLIYSEHGASYDETFAKIKNILANLKPGVTELYIHAAVESDEIKSITNAWRNRDYDYRVFKSLEMKDVLDSLGIQLIGWRDLQNLQIEQMGTGVPILKPKATHDFILLKNYPNPFNSRTMIQYSLSQTMDVTLKIYNLLGEEVATLINEMQSAGNHQIQWDGRDDYGTTVSSGLYFYEIHANGAVKTNTMTVIK